METQAMTIGDTFETNKQQINSIDNILELNDYLSFYRNDGREINFLNLDRCLRQPYIINDISDNQLINGISLSHNYLIQMPIFVSNYTNLIELNVSHNELNNTDFILYKPLNDNELTESYWNQQLKINSNNQSFKKIYDFKEGNCRINEKTNNNEQTKVLSTKNTNSGKHSKSSTSLSTKQISRPLIHPFLEHINLSFNHIKYLPTNIHYLRFLHTLNLSHNYLTELPSNIGYLEQLNTLILNHNYLKYLPNTFTRLIQLEKLNLSNNYFQSIDIIKNFSNLKLFSINSNPLKIFPILLYTCLNLEDLSFSNIQLNQMNNITFDIFYQFSKLKKLNLSKNNLENNFLLSSSSSSSIKQFDYLEELNFQYNHFTNIYSLLSNMKSLHLLDLSYNSLNNIPECLNLNLKILYLSYNNIELNSNDCIYLKYIIELDLDHNQIKQIPNEFIQCLYLESLNISYNQLKKFPDIILELRSLNKLIINDSKFQYLTTKNLFEKFFYRTINILNLSNNNLHTNLNELTCLKALTYLDLSSNYLYELDHDFKLLTCLKILKLNKNKFTKFPSWLYEMSNNNNNKQKYIAETLLELYISDNKIESIPDDIVHMINLQTIDLSKNQFLKFPNTLVYLEQLTSLIYSQEHGIHINKLPDDFIHLYNLKKLDLSHNIFNEIPDMIYNLTKLEYLNMSYNLLTNIDNNRLKQLKNFKIIKLNGNNFTSFPSIIYQLEIFNLNENPLCLAPPNDFLDDKYISATSNLYVQINDKYEEKLFEIYQKIFIENLTSYDIENLLIRLKLSKNDMNHFRNNYFHLKRENKIEILLNIWKEKRGTLANSDALYKFAQLIGDKNLVEKIHRAYLLARKIRI
ncbi:unnamed protein product [Rotaria sordida]|uniref:Death domain-containing protein n=1 Tax=Rotaria sordida TaxID=392033 RepID=A0A818LQW9_9BILA|nr:unnamed protein product [Rotaria sordida]